VAVLFIAFVVTPIAEVWLLLRIGGLIGAGPTIALVLTTGALGAWLARREGMRAMRAFVEQSQQGVVPGRAMFDAFAIFAGGALLLTPGVITDVLGLLLLLPPTRALVRRIALAWLARRIAAGNIVIQGVRPPSTARPQVPPDRIYDQTFDDSSDGR